MVNKPRVPNLIQSASAEVTLFNLEISNWPWEPSQSLSHNGKSEPRNFPRQWKPRPACPWRVLSFQKKKKMVENHQDKERRRHAETKWFRQTSLKTPGQLSLWVWSHFGKRGGLGTKTDLSWACGDAGADNRHITRKYAWSAKAIVMQQVAVESEMKTGVNDLKSATLKRWCVQSTAGEKAWFPFLSHFAGVWPRSQKRTHTRGRRHTDAHEPLYPLICILIKWGHGGCWDNIEQSKSPPMVCGFLNRSVNF